MSTAPNSQAYIQEISQAFQENLPIGDTLMYLKGLNQNPNRSLRGTYQKIQSIELRVQMLSEIWHQVIRPQYISQFKGDGQNVLVNSGISPLDARSDAKKTQNLNQFVKTLMGDFLRGIFVSDRELSARLVSDFCQFFKNKKSDVSKISFEWKEDVNLLLDVHELLDGSYLRLCWIEYISGSNNKELIVDFIDETLSRTLNVFHRISQNPKIQSYIDENSMYLSDKMSLSDAQKNVFSKYIAFSSQGDFNYPLYSFVTDEAFYDLASAAWGETPSDWKSMVGPNSLLHKKGFVSDRDEEWKIDDFLSPKWKRSLFTNILSQNYGSETEFWKKFVSREKILVRPSETIHEFPQLGRDFETLRSILSSDFNPKILLIAPQGYGSTTLIDTLAHLTNKSIFKHNSAEGGVEATRTSAQMMDNVLLSFENPSLDKKNKTVLGKSHHPEIWVVASEDDVPQHDMEDFDLVINFPQASYEQRKKIANDHLNDEHLASQIAKSCPTPKSIMKVVQWSQKTGQNSWEDLSFMVANMQKSILASKKSTSPIPVEMFHLDKMGFEMVVGCDDGVQKAKAIVSAFKHPERFQKLPSSSIPKGVLLSGPPGTGKTHMVRAMAKEAGVPLLVASSAELAAHPEKITDVFQEAKRQAPCILFFDEVDALGARGKNRDGSPASPERLKILNKFLTEVDGFEKISGVLIVGATHRAENLDEALVRSGRLGWNIHLSNPEKDARIEILKLYAQVDGLDWDRLGRASAGMSPADLSEAISRASMFAVLDGSDTLQTSNVLRAIDEMTWGEHSSKKVRQDEMYRTAVHEAGHALLAWKNKCDIDRICVQPTSHSLGFVRHFRDEDKMSTTFEEVKQNIQLLFAGLVAEEVVLGSRALGANSDLEKIRRWSGKIFYDEGYSEQYIAGMNQMNAPADHQSRLQEEQEKFLQDLKGQTTDILKNNAEFIKVLAQHLVSKREISGEELEQFIKEHQRLVFVNDTQDMDLPVASVKKFRAQDPRPMDLFPASNPLKM